MNLVTQSALAKLANVSRQAVGEMVKKEMLPYVSQGKRKMMDLDSEEIQYYLKGNRQREQVHTELKTEKDVPVKSVKKTNKSNKEKNKEIAIEDPEMVLDGIPEDLKSMSKHDLDRMKAAVTILKDRLKHDKDRQEVIDRMLIQKAFHELYQIDSEEFLQASAAISPRICQDVFETNAPEVMTKVSEILDTEFYKIQNHIRVTFDKHLKAMNLEAVS